MLDSRLVIRALWVSFLVVWAGALFWFGAVRPVPLAVTALAMAVLYALSLVLLPEPPRMSKACLLFLSALGGVLLLQALPLPFLYPHATELRRAHGVGTFWPGTADAFLSVKFTAQAAAYVLAGLLVLRLRQAGLSTSSAIRGLLLVAGLEAGWGVVRRLMGIEWIPLYNGTPPPLGSVSGTLVNRNNFAGLCAMGLALSTALAASRFTWPPRREDETGQPTVARRLESGAAWALLAGLFAAAIVMSRSRGGALAALAGLGVLSILHRGRTSVTAVVALVAGLVVAVVAANPAELMWRLEHIDPFEASDDMRWKVWTSTASAALRQPVLGFGVGTHPNSFHPFQPIELGRQVQHAHSEYVNVLFEAGVIGLLIALAAIGAWLARARRGLRTLHGPDLLPAAGAVAAVIAVLLHSLVDFDLRITGVGLMWSALAGLVASLTRDAVPTKVQSWAVTVLSLAAGLALAFAPLKSPGLTPYDAEVALKAAMESRDPRKFELAASIFPSHAALQRDTGLIFWEMGDAPRAAACFQRLFTQKPEEVEAILDLIHESGRPVAEYEALLPGTPSASAHLAAWLAKAGDWKSAMQVWDRGVSRNTESPAPHDYVAAAFQQAGQWGLEAQVRERRLEARSDAWAQGACAEAWLRLGVYDKALERAAGAERIDLENGRWSALKAEILLAKADVLGALESYSEALRRNPAEPEYRLRRGGLALQQRMYQFAADDFREVRRSNPDDRRALLGLARALIALTQRNDARTLLDDWLSHHPDDAEADALRTILR